MTRFTKTSTGKYVVSGHKYEMLIGTRAQVWHGTAYKTSGGLVKKDLMQNKTGRIVSRAKFVTAKKEMRLVKAGYGTKKGKFGYVKLHGKSKKMRGGNNSNSNSNNSSNNSSSGSSNLMKAAVLSQAMGSNSGNSNGNSGNSNHNNSNSNNSSSSYKKGGTGVRASVLSNYAGTRGGSKRRHKRGGMVNLPLSPSYYDGKGVGTSGVELQFIAGQGN